MGCAVDGYRAAIQRAYGFDLPPAADPTPKEPAPDLSALETPGSDTSRSALDQIVSDALVDLVLDRNASVVEGVASVMADLGLNRMRPRRLAACDPRTFDLRLLTRLRCPKCGGRLAHDDKLMCRTCGSRFALQRGVVDLIEDAEPR